MSRLMKKLETQVLWPDNISSSNIIISLTQIGDSDPVSASDENPKICVGYESSNHTPSFYIEQGSTAGKSGTKYVYVETITYNGNTYNKWQKYVTPKKGAFRPLIACPWEGEPAKSPDTSEGSYVYVYTNIVLTQQVQVESAICDGDGNPLNGGTYVEGDELDDFAYSGEYNELTGNKAILYRALFTLYPTDSDYIIKGEYITGSQPVMPIFSEDIAPHINGRPVIVEYDDGSGSTGSVATFYRDSQSQSTDDFYTVGTSAGSSRHWEINYSGSGGFEITYTEI